MKKKNMIKDLEQKWCYSFLCIKQRPEIDTYY